MGERDARRGGGCVVSAGRERGLRWPIWSVETRVCAACRSAADNLGNDFVPELAIRRRVAPWCVSNVLEGAPAANLHAKISVHEFMLETVGEVRQVL